MVFIFVLTNYYEPVSQVNSLFLARLPFHLYFFSTVFNFVLWTKHIKSWSHKMQNTTLEWITAFAMICFLKVYYLRVVFQQPIKFPKIAQQSLLYLELRRPVWLLGQSTEGPLWAQQPSDAKFYWRCAGDGLSELIH